MRGEHPALVDREKDPALVDREIDPALVDREKDPVLVDREAAVLRIRLNRPAVLNAMTDTLMGDLHAALMRAAKDPTVRAVLLSGEGRGFCAGADLAASGFVAPEAADMPQPDPSSRSLPAAAVGEKLRTVFNPVILAMRTLPKPIVTAVNGVAAGAGMSLALAGDIILCGESATFLQAFSRIGLIPDAGSTWFLPRLVGDAKARALVMLAERISAAEAERIGLVAKVVADAELASFSMRTAQYLAGMPTAAYALSKQALHLSLGADLVEQLEREAQLQTQAAATEDSREGVRAFLEKRTPTFKGR